LKRTIIIVSIGLCAFFLKSNAQTGVDFGVKGGLNLTFFKVKEGQFGSTIETEAGFYTGVFADFAIDKTVSFQPEVLYIHLNDFKFINVPFYAKLHMTNRLDFMAGPSLNYFFDFFNNRFKIRGDIATSYRISESLDFHIKFVIGFTEVAPNGLFFGAGYTF
jgi:hypothetical protein